MLNATRWRLPAWGDELIIAHARELTFHMPEEPA